MSILLQIEKLDKYYGNKHNITKALNHVSFRVEKGEFLGIMGSSGSGKTTLLNCLATICRATAGHIYLEGRDITALKNQELADFRKENLGFVFQDFNLLDHFTLEENIGLALTLRGTPKEQVRKLVKQAARQLGIEGELEKMPAQVSGGQNNAVPVPELLLITLKFCWQMSQQGPWTLMQPRCFWKVLPA